MEKPAASNRNLVDTHAHLFEIRRRDPELFASIADRLATDCAFLVEIGINLDNTAQRQELLRQYRLKYYTIGIYPSHALSGDLPRLLQDLEAQLTQWTQPQDLRIVALGEIGIDYFRDYGPRQTDLFIDQIRLANRFGLPIIVHCRQSEAAIAEAFAVCRPEYGGIMHCFSLGPEWLKPFLDLGLYISFAGNVTYKNADLIRSSAAACPLDRLLSETDAPYLSPKPYQTLTNTPLRVGQTIAQLAELKGLDFETMAAQLSANARTCFRV